MNAPEIPHTSPQVPAEPVGSVRIRVSLVEDDAQLRTYLSEWLNQADGFVCYSAFPSGEAALAALPGNPPDVIVMDINLPGMNGVECVLKLKPLLPKTQFVMLTVYEDSDHIFQALQAGATGYLLKQTPREELLAALRDVFRGGSPMTSNIARKVVLSFQQSREPNVETDQLSGREKEVIELLAQGYLYKEIASALNVTVPTVNTYIRRVYEKLHVRSRAQAVARYTQPLRGRTRP